MRILDLLFWRIVLPPSFETVAVSNIVAMLFVEFVVRHSRKGFPPVDERFFDRQPDPL